MTGGRAHRGLWSVLVPALLVALVGTAASVAAGDALHAQVERRSEESFARAAEDVATTVATSFRRAGDLASASAAHVARTDDLGGGGFAGWFDAAATRSRHPAVFSASHVSRVPHGELEAYHAVAAAEFGGHLPRAIEPPGTRPSYCLVRHVWLSDPEIHGALPLGAAPDFCTGDDAVRRAAASGRVAVGERYVPGLGRMLGIVAPVPRADVTVDAGPPRAADEWVSVAIDVDHLLADSLRTRPELGVTVEAVDRDGPGVDLGRSGPAPGSDSLVHEVVLNGDVRWRITVEAPRAAFDQGATVQRRAVTVVGVVLSLLGAALFASVGTAAWRSRRLVERRTAELGESEARFRSLSATSPVGLAHWSPEGTLLYANDRFRTMFPATATATGAEGASDDAAPAPDRYLRLLEVAAELAPDDVGELCVVAEGDRRWVHVRRAPLADGSSMTTVTDVTAEVRDREALHHAAHHDALTGLANRSAFFQAVDAGATAPVVVLYLDLDRFKEVNDSLGHTAGDELLVQVGRRITEIIRPGDLVARLGGDEFAVLLGDVEPGIADAVTQRIEAELSAPYPLRAGVATIGVSIGMAVAADGALDAALRAADEDMYRRKTRRRAGPDDGGHRPGPARGQPPA